MRARLPLVACAALSACTFGPGAPFASLDGGSFTAGFDPGARALGDGAVISDLGATWSLDRAELALESISVQELQGASGVTFDPASPPPGYTLCHGGHCHAEDGSLVDYSEVQAELAGSSASLVPITGWTPTARIDLLAGDAIDLGPPDLVDLPQVTLTRVVVRSTVRLAGAFVPDGVTEVPFDLELPGFEVSADLGLVIDRSAPASMVAALDWTMDGTLLDGVEEADALSATVSENLSLNPLIAVLEER